MTVRQHIHAEFCRWGPTFRRLSVQVNAVQAIVLTGLMFVPLPLHFVTPILILLLVCAIGAARIPQKSVRTYDPRTHYLVPIDPHGDVNE